MAKKTSKETESAVQHSGPALAEIEAPEPAGGPVPPNLDPATRWHVAVLHRIGDQLGGHELGVLQGFDGDRPDLCAQPASRFDGRIERDRQLEHEHRVVTGAPW